MTISYADNFAKLLLRWKGSIWKSIWPELSVFLALYYALRLIYSYLLSASQRATFEKMAVMFDEYTRQIPLTFLLGFYVALIVKRWWEQFECVAWPDDLLSFTCSAFPDDDSESECARHTIARYLNLTSALAWREISVKVRSRFPLIDSLVAAGLMTDDEQQMYENTQVGSVRWQLPICWVQRIVDAQFYSQRLSAPLYSHYLRELILYREKFHRLFCYDWVCVPLVYTQVAALATYGYFTFCLLGRQYLHPELPLDDYNKVDMIIPVFTILQFLFFVGWFKVGQDLMRPFGTDDDDIELNYILDRNVAASFCLVHQVFNQRPFGPGRHPPDQLFAMAKNGETVVLPHTRISAKIKEHPPKMHAAVNVTNPRDIELDPQLVHVDVNASDHSAINRTGANDTMDKVDGHGTNGIQRLKQLTTGFSPDPRPRRSRQF